MCVCFFFLYTRPLRWVSYVTHFEQKQATSTLIWFLQHSEEILRQNCLVIRQRRVAEEIGMLLFKLVEFHHLETSYIRDLQLLGTEHAVRTRQGVSRRKMGKIYDISETATFFTSRDVYSRYGRFKYRPRLKLPWPKFLVFFSRPASKFLCSKLN